ncbi:MAG: DEAD/DEAH box helicase, partial [Gammaproteobacteria bacterium]|nr:DEAD/DEAH box helicase [Gammaproteobacteria bacterium]
MTTSFFELLDEIRDAKRSEKDVGDRFEEIVQVYFNHDSQMQQVYTQATSWKDWVRKHREEESIKDVGIDLVARVKDGQGNGFAAIQAKCRQKSYKLQKKDIDSFYTTADSQGFKTLIFIDTTEVDPSPHFQEVVDRRQITHIRVKDLVESTVDWDSFIDRGEKCRRKPKEPRPHQLEAVEKVREGFDSADRGQIIMACGTGKTYTGLLVAEKLFGVGKRVLVLVPSLALMSQMIREWHADATVQLRSYSVCSDSEVGRRGRSSDDVIQLTPSELKIPPTTDAANLANKASSDAPSAITVVFGTYHSIEVVHAAQHEHGLPNFDLIVCDEAHRTTGQFDKGKEEEASMFVRVHDAEYVRSRKRLYMTATPRIYTTSSKSKAAEGAITLCSMDNPEQFGNVLFYKSFAWAVENELLSDYRVIVLALDEQTISNALQNILESDDSDIKLDDATKIVGCYKALMKDPGPDRAEEFVGDAEPSRRALAFCNTIKNSEIISREFNRIVQELAHDNPDSENGKLNFDCSTKHIDGTAGAHERNNRLSWLGDEPNKNELRILSNVRCLGEGVDVPSLDAIVFFHPRKSQIDVVQAVGRVMRRAPGKKYGYVVLPVAIPAGKNPVESLKDNKTYDTVWQILNALRSHDERLEAEINRLQLEGEDSGRIFIGLPETASGMLRQQTGSGGETGTGNGK